MQLKLWNNVIVQEYIYMCVCVCVCLPGGSEVKNLPANAGDMGLISEEANQFDCSVLVR